MPENIVVPPVGESISEGTVSEWLKNVGDICELDEPIVAIDTDKVSVEIPSPVHGKLISVSVSEGDVVAVGQVIGILEEVEGEVSNESDEEEAEAEAAPVKIEEKPEKPVPAPAKTDRYDNLNISVDAKNLAASSNLNLDGVIGTGRDGEITKWDVEKKIQSSAPAAKSSSISAPTGGWPKLDLAPTRNLKEKERRVEMTRIRKRIAERLVQAQHTAAILTTFNEVDMSAVMNLRKRYKEGFKEKHGVGLGFMSFFTKATVYALQSFPLLNAEIDGESVIYKDYYDIGVAVSSERGLVVPVLRNADKMDFADVEKGIYDLAVKAKNGKLTMNDLTGGTFTISNGGIFGSMMSTPLLNPPQVGILGMHNIVKRAVVTEGDKIEVRPMMYLALSYDHRLIDGREAVQFLFKIKTMIENPDRLLLDL